MALGSVGHRLGQPRPDGSNSRHVPARKAIGPVAPPDPPVFHATTRTQ